MNDAAQMGPIDYLLVEWPGKQPEGEIAPYLVDLVDRGLIRILDLAFLTKGEDGTIAVLEIADIGGEVTELAVFEGACAYATAAKMTRSNRGLPALPDPRLQHFRFLS